MFPFSHSASHPASIPIYMIQSKYTFLFLPVYICSTYHWPKQWILTKSESINSFEFGLRWNSQVYALRTNEYSLYWPGWVMGRGTPYIDQGELWEGVLHILTRGSYGTGYSLYWPGGVMGRGTPYIDQGELWEGVLPILTRGSYGKGYSLYWPGGIDMLCGFEPLFNTDSILTPIFVGLWFLTPFMYYLFVYHFFVEFWSFWLLFQNLWVLRADI